jgi:3-oxoacyl-[acyl-carrier protein] reductase
VVTGGGSGIGRAIAAAFAGEGTHVAILGRYEEKLRNAAAQMGPNVAPFKPTSVAGQTSSPPWMPS